MPGTASPRLVSRKQLLAHLGGISGTTLARWIDEGRVPRALPGTTRWDLKAVNAALDRASGLVGLTAANEPGFDPLDAERQELDRLFGTGPADDNDRPPRH